MVSVWLAGQCVWPVATLRREMAIDIQKDVDELGREDRLARPPKGSDWEYTQETGDIPH